VNTSRKRRRRDADIRSAAAAARRRRRTALNQSRLYVDGCMRRVNLIRDTVKWKAMWNDTTDCKSTIYVYRLHEPTHTISAKAFLAKVLNVIKSYVWTFFKRETTLKRTKCTHLSVKRFIVSLSPQPWRVYTTSHRAPVTCLQHRLIATFEPSVTEYPAEMRRMH